MNTILKTKLLSRKYGKGDDITRALDKVSLDIIEGQTVAIVGRSGSGKSTLMHALTGLDTPTGGVVQFEGEDIYNKNFQTDEYRGRNIGIIFQQFFLQANDTVIENVCLPLKIQGISRRQRVAMAKVALDLVGLNDKVKSKAGDLSGGQKQRVAIARAIAAKPKLIFADEPTGNLDTENSRIIEDLLFELNTKNATTLIIITHDIELAQKCDRIIKISDGKIVDDLLTRKPKS